MYNSLIEWIYQQINNRNITFLINRNWTFDSNWYFRLIKQIDSVILLL